MNKEEIAQKLVKEEKENRASSAFFHICAMRERSRGSIYLNSLYNKMKKAGFNYPRSEYVSVLTLLASVGFGTLELSPRGKVSGIKHIKTSLRAIGEAACGGKVDFKPFKGKHRFDVVKPEPAKKQLALIKTVNHSPTKSTSVEVSPKTSMVKIKMIDIPMPNHMTSDEIANLVTKLKYA